MKTFYTKIFTIIFFVLFSFNLFSQSNLRGMITDSLTGAQLIGANVTVMGTSLGDATNIEGKYLISRLQQKEYNLRVSYIGYKTKFLNVNINSKDVTLNIELSPDVIEGEAVIITGQAYGQVTAINQQINSNTIINVVSEEKIQELPDVNAAEVIGRLSGVSIQRSGGEANKIVLRGLSDKFGSVTVDGIRIAATDVNSRGIDLSTISQGSLAGIELYKALTPDKDADAIAGSVNLVTKKAPSERLLRFDSKGIYNQLNNNLKQYDFALKYGERFFDDLLGVQVTGNLERRDRSNETYNISYGSIPSKVEDWEITDFTLQYKDEIRKRGGFSLLLDVNTPDSGSIKVTNVFNSTKRDYITYSRNYPTGTADLLYTARDREQEIKTFNSSLRGENHFFDVDASWGISFAQSLSEDPYDFSLDFMEPSSSDSTGIISKMKNVPQSVRKGPPELLIPYACNNFQKAFLNWGYYRFQKNIDKEKTVYLDLSRKYTIGDLFAGEIKLGGKYRHKTRFKESSELDAAYYLYGYHKYEKLADGTVRLKNLSGTRFSNLALINSAIISSNFLDPTPKNRNIYDLYLLNPLVNRDALRDWYTYNKYGVANSNGTNPEYSNNNEVEADYYDIVERVKAFYLMNTLTFGQDITFIAGLRVESEDNDYLSKFTPGKLTGFPSPSGIVKDTSAAFKETVWLPNFHLSIRPTDFITIRFAFYRALARPDFNQRLEYYIARDGGGATTLDIGNPRLKSAKAWNYEINTSFYSNVIGLFSISAFYKKIDDMFHLVDGVRIEGQSILDSIGIPYKSPFATQQAYDLTYPYNSNKPTKVWGFEIEHQTNLTFLPGLLKNLVLTYNVSFVKSETYITSSRVEKWIDTIYIVIPPLPPIPTPRENSKYVLQEIKQKLEGQPEIFGNIALGYDIGGFSGRISVFYQSEYNSIFSGDAKSDRVVNSFTRWDLALKYQVTENIAVLFNLNNFTNIEEGTTLKNRVYNWSLAKTSERYDLTSDLGVRITF